MKRRHNPGADDRAVTPILAARALRTITSPSAGLRSAPNAAAIRMDLHAGATCRRLGRMNMPESTNLLKLVTNRLDQEKFRHQHWEGTFQDYLDIVAKNPRVARNAFQRVFDMILGYGFEKYTLFKADIVKYNFFSDPIDSGADAVFGLDKAIERLVDIFKSAAQGLGTEKRILLLHGPVGSAKSTIARLLK